MADAPRTATTEEAARLDERGEHLLAAIRVGDCVAFVGAGFTAPATGTWKSLLLDLAHGAADEALIATVTRRLSASEPRSFDFEAAAEAIKARLGDRFVPAVAAVLDRPPPEASAERVAGRLRALRSIPLRAILTVNVDRYLWGDVGSEAAYRSVLRPEEPSGWASPRF